MLGGLFVLCLVASYAKAIKETWEPEIPAENWANKDLYNEDILNGIPIGERMRNLRNGKYKITASTPGPHRTEDGKIIIENSQLYNEDIRQYGICQAREWVKQGKYNLSQWELKKRQEELNAEW